MPKKSGVSNIWAVFICIITITLISGAICTPVMATSLPEFTHQTPQTWLNSEPLQRVSLVGQVVLVHFWTFECWNCYRSFPWLNAMEQRLAPLGLKIIGIHTPEFAHEKIRENIEQKISQFKLTHPVMMDNDFSYWKAMKNRYWPAYFLVGQDGQIKERYYGETHSGDTRAKQIEATLRSLLAEVGP